MSPSLDHVAGVAMIGAATGIAVGIGCLAEWLERKKKNVGSVGQFFCRWTLRVLIIVGACGAIVWGILW